MAKRSEPLPGYEGGAHCRLYCLALVAELGVLVRGLLTGEGDVTVV